MERKESNQTNKQTISSKSRRHFRTNYWQVKGQNILGVLFDFSLTVKAATLIFISGRGSAILSAMEVILW